MRWSVPSRLDLKNYCALKLLDKRIKRATWDAILRFIKKYRLSLLCGIPLIVLAVAGFRFVQHRQLRFNAVAMIKSTGGYCHDGRGQNKSVGIQFGNTLRSKKQSAASRMREIEATITMMRHLRVERLLVSDPHLTVDQLVRILEQQAKHLRSLNLDLTYTNEPEHFVEAARQTRLNEVMIDTVHLSHRLIEATASLGDLEFVRITGDAISEKQFAHLLGVVDAERISLRLRKRIESPDKLADIAKWYANDLSVFDLDSNVCIFSNEAPYDANSTANP